MSLNRWAKRRDSNAAEIIHALKTAGVTVEVIDVPCDLLLGFRGRDYLAEIKTSKGGLSPRQRLFHAKWPHPIPIFRSSDDALAWVKLKRKSRDKPG